MVDIRETLRRMEAIDPEYQLFGAKVHRYKLNPPLSMSELEHIEGKYGCEFPEEYRRFITTIGNGGAGPYYGLFPIETHDDGHGMSPWMGGHLIGDLTKPFQYRDKWNLPESFWSEQPDPDTNVSLEEEDALWEAWNDRLESVYWAPHVMNGAIPICHHGCAVRSWLVITGDEKGTVWDDFRTDMKGIVPKKNAHGERLSFMNWYMEWLNRESD